MRLWPLLLFVVTVLCRESSTVPDDRDTVGERGWIDPNDPTAGMDLKGMAAGPPLSSPSPLSPPVYGGRADASIKHILNKIFEELKVEPRAGVDFKRKAEIRLSAAKLERISAFLSAKEDNDWAAHERLRTDLEGMITVDDDYLSDSSSFSLSSLHETISPYIGMANVLLLFPAAFIVLRLMIGTRSLVLIGFWCFFAFSLYTTYDRKYHEVVASRIEASTTLRDSCRPLTMLESGLNYFKGLVSLERKSECRRFIESQQMSVMSEIQLTEVLAEVIFNGVFSAIPVLGSKLRLFFINFYDGMPPHIAIISTFMTLVGLFLLMGYRFTAPFIALEPHRGPSALAAGVSAAATAAAGVLLPNEQPSEQPVLQPVLQTLQEAAQLPQLTHRRPEKKLLPVEERPARSERNALTDRERSGEREHSGREHRDSWVTPRSPMRRSRMMERQKQGEEKYRSISLPRKYQ